MEGPAHARAEGVTEEDALFGPGEEADPGPSLGVEAPAVRFVDFERDEEDVIAIVQDITGQRGESLNLTTTGVDELVNEPRHALLDLPRSQAHRGQLVVQGGAVRFVEKVLENEVDAGVLRDELHLLFALDEARAIPRPAVTGAELDGLLRSFERPGLHATPLHEDLALALFLRRDAEARSKVLDHE